MEADKQSLEKLYADMDNNELMSLNSGELTAIAKETFQEEMSKRGLDIKNATIHKEHPYGVGGWLAFFVITSSIGLVWGLISNIVALNKLISFVSHSSDERIILLGIIFFYVGFAIFCFGAICATCVMEKYAVTMVKSYLIAITIFDLIVIVIISTMLHREIFDTDEAMKFYIVSVFIRSIWYAYFSLSKRVKNTFPEIKPVPIVKQKISTAQPILNDLGAGKIGIVPLDDFFDRIGDTFYKMKNSAKVCPFCAEKIKAAAIVCKHCGRDLPQSKS